MGARHRRSGSRAVPLATVLMLAFTATGASPAHAIACDRTVEIAAKRWVVRYECNRPEFDLQAVREFKRSTPMYPARIQGEAGSREPFRFRVSRPSYHGVWSFRGVVGGRSVLRGGVDAARTGKSYVVASGMRLDGQLVTCQVEGSPQRGWREVHPRRQTRAACLASTILMFELVIGPYLKPQPL